MSKGLGRFDVDSSLDRRHQRRWLDYLTRDPIASSPIRRFAVSLVNVVLIVAFFVAVTPTEVQAFTCSPVFWYYHGDHLGSSNIITDRSGNSVWHHEYSAFGKERYNNVACAFDVSNRYTDQILDDDTGFYYYNARYYDPELGRFIQPDTIVPDPLNPQELNRYTYVRNNPLNYIDPTGHTIIIIWIPHFVPEGPLFDVNDHQVGWYGDWVNEPIVLGNASGGGLGGGSGGGGFARGGPNGGTGISNSGGITGSGSSPQLTLGGVGMGGDVFYRPQYWRWSEYISAVPEIPTDTDSIQDNTFGFVNDILLAIGVGEARKGLSVSFDLALGLAQKPGTFERILGEFAENVGGKTYFDVYGEGLPNFQVLENRLTGLINSADRIHFNLDHFNLSRYEEFLANPVLRDQNITNWELYKILNTPSYLEKTIFYDPGTIVFPSP